MPKLSKESLIMISLVKSLSLDLNFKDIKGTLTYFVCLLFAEGAQCFKTRKVRNAINTSL